MRIRVTVTAPGDNGPLAVGLELDTTISIDPATAQRLVDEGKAEVVVDDGGQDANPA